MASVAVHAGGGRCYNWGRVLRSDSVAAHAHTEIVAVRCATGHPVSLADRQIAAIARSRHLPESRSTPCWGMASRNLLGRTVDPSRATMRPPSVKRLMMPSARP